MSQNYSKSRISEIPSYVYIKNELEVLGWNTHNPNRNIYGEVYTQQECLDNDEIKLYLNKQRPEYTVKISEDKYYVIEAKGECNQIDTAYQQAKDYAQKINKSSIISVMFISGVAGNDEDGYIVKSGYLLNDDYETICYHNKELTSLLSKEIINEILQQNSANISELIISESRMLQVAEQINETLHVASIYKDERASVMAALLLSMLGDTMPNYNASPEVFIRDINNRALDILNHYNKHDFYDYIKIKVKDSSDTLYKYKHALSKTMFLLLKINIRAAMSSGTDILGKFYEVFLKYGNGAKDIGIVLTPRHITNFASEILQINYQDIIYDPACGTGGFLVAAYDYVRKHSSEAQVNSFKTYRIFGVEQQPRTALLAIVNMIFRGDGNNNIINNNCLTQMLTTDFNNEENEKSAKFISINAESKNKTKYTKPTPPVTKVLMNPPFALKSKDEKEYKFVQHALNQMVDGGILFAILPVSVMTKGGETLKWRKNILLKNNTLLSVVTFPEDLFYPIGVNTCGVFICKGHKHPINKQVLWIKMLYDGCKKLKGKRLPNKKEPNQIPEVQQHIKLFINDDTYPIKNIPQYMKKCPINFDDKDCELIPEAYLDTAMPNLSTINKAINIQMREYVAYLIRNQMEDTLYEKGINN